LDFNILWLFRKPTTQISRLHNSAKKFWVDFCTDALKGNLHSFSFPWMHIYVLKILQIFLHVWICWVRAFYKCIIYYISRTFRYKTSFGNKYVRKCKFAKFFCRLIKRCPRAFLRSEQILGKIMYKILCYLKFALVSSFKVFTSMASWSLNKLHITLFTFFSLNTFLYERFFEEIKKPFFL